MANTPTPAKMVTVRAPSHFISMAQFRLYILHCAIENREGFLDAMAGVDDPEVKGQTIAELKAMKALHKKALAALQGPQSGTNHDPSH